MENCLAKQLYDRFTRLELQVYGAFCAHYHIHYVAGKQLCFYGESAALSEFLIGNIIRQ